MLKNLFVAATVLFAAGINTSFTAPENAKSASVTVKYAFKNIEEGYDHDTRTQIYIDDELIATSTVKKQSKPNSVTANTTPGKHSLRVVNQALYEGTWEDHTIANNYSIDCMYEAELSIKKPVTINLMFDIDSGTEKVKKL